MNDEKKQPSEIPIEIFPSQISSDALNGIIENFILREGTDYGIIEVEFEKKKNQIQRQIDRGEVKIVFDQSTETVSILTNHDFKRLQKKAGSV